VVQRSPAVSSDHPGSLPSPRHPRPSGAHRSYGTSGNQPTASPGRDDLLGPAPPPRRLGAMAGAPLDGTGAAFVTARDCCLRPGGVVSYHAMWRVRPVPRWPSCRCRREDGRRRRPPAGPALTWSSRFSRPRFGVEIQRNLSDTQCCGALDLGRGRWLVRAGLRRRPLLTAGHAQAVVGVLVGMEYRDRIEAGSRLPRRPSVAVL
jgi:hypothetical protein